MADQNGKTVYCRPDVFDRLKALGELEKRSPGRQLEVILDEALLERRLDSDCKPLPAGQA